MPYVDHREAWRRAYLHLFGSIEEDEELLALFVQENDAHAIAQKKALAGANKAKSFNISRRSTTSVAKGEPKQVASDQIFSGLVEVSPKDAQRPFFVFADPASYLLPDPQDSDRRMVISLNTLPNSRWLQTRDLILQNLFESKICGYTIHLKELTKFGPPAMWADQYGVMGVETGNVHWMAPGQLNYFSSPLWFNSQELESAFPPKRKRTSGITNRRKTTKAERIAQYLLQIWPGGIAEAPYFESARTRILEEIGGGDFTFGRDVYNEAWKIVEQR